MLNTKVKPKILFAPVPPTAPPHPCPPTRGSMVQTPHNATQPFNTITARHTHRYVHQTQSALGETCVEQVSHKYMGAFCAPRRDESSVASQRLLEATPSVSCAEPAATPLHNQSMHQTLHNTLRLNAMLTTVAGGLCFWHTSKRLARLHTVSTQYPTAHAAGHQPTHGMSTINYTISAYMFWVPI